MSSHSPALSDALGVTLPSPLQRITDERLAKAGVTLYLKRDDLISNYTPGNKWRKIKYNVLQAQAEGHQTLLTFGGAYSNHLRAVASVGKKCGFRTVGIVRGEPHSPLNWSLQHCVDNGMELKYLDRETYRRKHSDITLLEALKREYGHFYLIPEGGSNALALKGCREIIDEITIPFDVICSPVGTGGTLAGLVAGLHADQRAIGFSALKGGDFLRHDVSILQKSAIGTVMSNWEIITDYHFGGFARKTPTLEAFINDFYTQHGLQLEWVYVAKMMYGIFDVVASGKMRNKTIIALITGAEA